VIIQGRRKFVGGAAIDVWAQAGSLRVLSGVNTEDAGHLCGEAAVVHRAEVGPLLAVGMAEVLFEALRTKHNRFEVHFIRA